MDGRGGRRGPTPGGAVLVADTQPVGSGCDRSTDRAVDIARRDDMDRPEWIPVLGAVQRLDLGWDTAHRRFDRFHSEHRDIAGRGDMDDAHVTMGWQILP